MGSVWGRTRAACQLIRLSSLKKCQWRKGPECAAVSLTYSWNTGCFYSFTFWHQGISVQIWCAVFHISWIRRVGMRDSEKGLQLWPAWGLFCKLPYIWCHTTQHWYTAVKAAKGHIVLCVCAELFCSMTNERGPSNCWNTVALPILWVRMDVPSRGGGDGSMHLADSWWKVKIVSITLLWPSKQQPLTHTHARTHAHTLRSLTLKHYS